MSKARKGTRKGKLSAQATNSFKPPPTSAQKKTAAEKRRLDSNDELRTARCIMCRGKRTHKGSYPIHHECTTRKKNDGVVTLRPYLLKLMTRKERDIG